MPGVTDDTDFSTVTLPPAAQTTSAGALTAIALASAAALAACGGGGGGGDASSATETPVGGRSVALQTTSAAMALSGSSISAEQASRFLLQAQFLSLIHI